jgi:hypothetical protein
MLDSLLAQAKALFSYRAFITNLATPYVYTFMATAMGMQGNGV